jgi:hypothetical protein
VFLIVTHAVDSSVRGNSVASSGAYLEFMNLRIVECYAYFNVLPESTRREYNKNTQKLSFGFCYIEWVGKCLKQQFMIR